MKKIGILLLAVTLCYSTQAQKNIKEIREVNVYGVDFSLVKTFAVTEMPSQMKYELSRINVLFIAEPNKYNIRRFMGKNVAAFYLESVDARNANMDETKMTANSFQNPLSEEQVKEVIQSLSSNSTEKTGLVFIAETLDKSNKLGTYLVVFFDEATKEIIYSKRVYGKAKGFGVRNYWAGSIYSFLKRWKY